MKEKIGSFSRRYWIVAILVLTLILSVSLVTMALPVQTENTIQVNWTGDEKKSNDGLCTLREAIISANQNSVSGNRPNECEAGSDTQTDIILLPPGVYILERTDNGGENSSNTGDLDILDDLDDLDYPGIDDLVVRGQPSGLEPVVITGDLITDRIFHVLSGNVRLENLTIRDGNSRNIGGGVLNSGADLTLVNVTLTGNYAQDSGGGLANEAGASTTLSHVTIAGNSVDADTGSGSGLSNLGGVSDLVVHSTIVDGDSCSGSITGAGVNMATDASCAANLTIVGDLKLADAEPTTDANEDSWDAYFPLQVSSPAVDAAIDVPAEDLYCVQPDPLKLDEDADPDQIGRTRPQTVISAACDLGAIELEAPNLPPVAGDTSVSMGERNSPDAPSLVLDLADIDGAGTAVAYDPEGALNLALNEIVTGPGTGEGTASISDTSLQLTYTPPVDFDDEVTIIYKIFDDIGQFDQGEITITVESDGFIEVTNTGTSGEGSLSWAIGEANNPLNPDKIIFKIPGDDYCDPQTINLTEPTHELPALERPMTIDATLLENGGSCDPHHITVDGGKDVEGVENNFDGLTIAENGEGSLIKGIHFTEFGGNGIFIEGAGLSTIGSSIQQNYISNNDGSGVVLGSAADPADGNEILNNTIDANCGSGVLIFGFEVGGIGGATAPGNITGNDIIGNTITNNGSCATDFPYGTPDGVTVPSGQNNQIIDNFFNGNAGEPIDLAIDGVSPNDGPNEEDIFDEDGGANTQQNFPYLDFALPGDSTTPGGDGGLILGKLFSTKGGGFTLQYYSSETCEPQNLTLLAVTDNFIADVSPSDPVPNDGIMFTATQAEAINTLVDGKFVMATATDQYGNTSEFGPCMEVDDDNSIFPRAWKAVPGTSAGQFSQPISYPGQVRWYYLQDVPAFSKITVNVTQPGNGVDVDVIGFKDLKKALAEQIGDKDLNELDAGNANNVLDTAQFNASYINPPYINESEYLATYINASYINASYINEALFSADLYSATYINPPYINDAYLNQTQYNASYINATYINASYINASYINASYINASYINGNAYSAAQMSSVISASANDGGEPEEMNMFTFNNPGDYYIRVQARNGTFDPNINFNVTFEVDDTLCGTVVEEDVYASANGGAAPSRLTGNTGNYEAIILVDWERMGRYDPANTEEENQAFDDLVTALNDLADPSDGDGIHAAIVEVDLDQEVSARNDQADDKWQCPYAKNLVADGIKEIIDSYRASNSTLEHIIILGNDDHIPFYRYPDQSGLGPEQQYVVPVDNTTTSFASLASNTFLSQDAYGSTLGVGMKNNTLPTPGLGVGRLVETPQQITNMISEYLEAPLIEPGSALVTSYDFLVDGGVEVSADLATSVPVIDLISNTWTATDLQNILNPGGSERLFDIGYLSGHFSATTAQAADYETLYDTSDLLQVPTDFYRGALIYSSGCHSGYNIVNDHAIPDYTPDNVDEPDWAAAMAQLGATFVGGTGYQYGDDEFVEYSERLYADFTRELLWGTGGGPIDIGTALVEAKKQYLLDTPVLSGIHQKALLEATVFGMPMKSVNMPGDGPPAPVIEDPLPESSLAQVTDMPFPPFTDNAAVDTPGEVLSLHFLDLGLPEGGGNYTWSEQAGTLVVEPYTNVNGGGMIDVSHLIGPDGVLVDAGAPVLPLDKFEATVEVENPVSPEDPEYYEWVLRGVGFLGGTYTDVPTQVPLVAAATTESSAVHSAFMSFAHFPQELWSINRFDQLGSDGERTILNTTPAQHKSEPSTDLQTSARRQFDDLQLRLFYLPTNFMDGLDTGFNDPEVAAAPDFVSVIGEPNGTDKVDFTTEVVVDPSAGIQQVWVSYTTVEVPTEGGEYKWIPFFLTQNQSDPSQWTGTLDLPAGVAPQQIRFMVTAVNGVGLPTLSNNYGLFYTVGEAADTVLTVDSYPPSGQIGDSIPFTAHLRLADGPTNFSEPQPVIVNVGTDYRLGWTNSSGDVTIDLPLVNSQPGFEYVNGVPVWSGEDYEVSISFPGTAEFAASTAITPNLFTVFAGSTNVTLDPAIVYVDSLQPDVPINAYLKDGDEAGQGRPLAELTVTFTVTNMNDGSFFKKAVITDQEGRARLGDIDLPEEATYQVTAQFGGIATYTPSSTVGFSEIKFNQPPDCSLVSIQTVQPSKLNLWPPNGDLIPVELVGAKDFEDDAAGLPLIYRLLQIYQDEQVLGNDFDATITNADPLGTLRADRDGNQDGRVYHVWYEVEDSAGAICTGKERMAVTHDQDNTDEALNLIDGGPLCNSLGPPDPTCVP